MISLRHVLATVASGHLADTDSASSRPLCGQPRVGGIFGSRAHPRRYRLSPHERIGHQNRRTDRRLSILLTRMGLYPGTYLYEWLGPILKELDTETFGNLQLGQADDPGV